MSIRHRLSPRTALAFLAAAVLWSSAGSISAERGSAIPATSDARTVLHVLNRIGFGARPGDLERVQQMGLAAYIDQQLHPERLADAELNARLADFTTLSMSTRELADKFFAPALEARRNQQLKQQKAEAKAAKATPNETSQTEDMKRDAAGDQAAPQQISPELSMARQNQQEVLNELTQAHIIRAALSERQLDEVLVDFWFNHFNVFVGKGQVREYLPEYERDVIRPRVLGSFRDLLGAVAHSPAMLFYLDNWQSATPNPQQALASNGGFRQRNPFITQPQRRQLMVQLQKQQQRPKQTRGLNENYGRELMELHTLGVDGGYTQKDVVEVARALTGWTIDRPQLGGRFVFRPEMHDAGEKIILGQKFPAGHGQDEGERVLDILAKHPSTAHHIAFELAQRFVADEPPPALVDRAAKKFLETKGDLREVTQVIISSPEFFAPEAYRAKVKSPLEFVISAVRTSGATIANAQPIAQALRSQFGMPLYGCQPPTGYSNTADAWVNTGALLSRMNFALQLVNGGQARPDARPNGQPFPAGRPAQLARAPLRVDVVALAPDTTDATRDRVIQSMLAGDVSDATKTVLAKAETPQHLVALVLGSPEFQRR